MKRYGLIGKPLGHSLSRRLFEERFPGVEYRLCELADVGQARGLGLEGFNVTIPYKESIIPLLDALDAEAEAIGAVNCVSAQGGRLVGHNTDWRAFGQTLAPLLKPWHTEALVLGRGGAAKAVGYALERMGIAHTKLGREATLPPGCRATLIVNCTPVGMAPLEGQSPWPHASALTPRHLCYDLVYNPEETLFLRQARQAGAQTLNGMAMLRRQAELSWRIWGLL